MVVPSGALLATWRAAIDPPAPPRLSTTICWPSASPSLSAMMRAMMVALPPGGNGTTSVIGRFGYCCAAAGGAAAPMAAVSAIIATIAIVANRPHRQNLAPISPLAIYSALAPDDFTTLDH